MIDKDGYRLNVGIVLINNNHQLFWGKRAKSMGWQFPQGGVQPYETLEETMYRELMEETGLAKEDVKILKITKRWLHYKLPTHMRRNVRPICIGQKQKWFLLLLTSGDDKVNLKMDGSKPEFSDWRWVKYWEPLKQVVYFKRDIYFKILKEFERYLKMQFKL